MQVPHIDARGRAQSAISGLCGGVVAHARQSFETFVAAGLAYATATAYLGLTNARMVRAIRSRR